MTPSHPPALAEALAEAVRHVRAHSDLVPQLAIVLGSGLGGFAEQLEAPTRLPYQHIPHMPRPHVAGHLGELVLGRLGGVPAVVLRGRVHAYEGHAQPAVTFGVRLCAALGASRLLVTNAAGGLNPHFVPGDLMMICDQLNFSGRSPLVGPNDDALGPRFVDMTDAYALSGRHAWQRAAAALGIGLKHGTYVGVLGPAYETPAEVRAFRALGGDAVGMSTVAEVLVARHQGLQVAGLSVITNLGAGLGARSLSHEEVTEVARESRGKVSELLLEMVRQWCGPLTPAGEG